MCRCRLLYRFVGTDEYQDIIAVRHVPYLMEDIHAYHARLRLLINNVIADPDFGNIVHDHTMAESGGGRIGGNQKLISFTSDENKLIVSTDDAVQRIVHGADYILTFEIPVNVAIEAPSDLSVSEGEVLVSNDKKALAACLIDWRINNYRNV